MRGEGDEALSQSVTPGKEWVLDMLPREGRGARGSGPAQERAFCRGRRTAMAGRG